MEDLHRELLKKRQKYLTENIIFEEGLLGSMREKGLFTTSMVQAIMSEKEPERQMEKLLDMIPKRGPEAYRKFLDCLAPDYPWISEKEPERQMAKLLDMIPKRGPEAYRKFLECLAPDYPWIVTNLTEKEEELVNGKGNPDVVPEVRRVIRDYVRELARTTRINVAQSRAIEDFLCRHITIDTNLTSAHVPGPKLFGIHKKVISAIPVNSLDEYDQEEIKSILPENVTVDKIEKEITLLVHRVNDLQTTIDNCYEKLGETNREKELPDLVYTLRKSFLEREIRTEEIKTQLVTSTKQLKVAKDKSKRAQELSIRSEEEKEDLQRSLDSLKTKIHRLQEERQRMGMRMAFDLHVPASAVPPSSPSVTRRRSIRERSFSAKDTGNRLLQSEMTSHQAERHKDNVHKTKLGPIIHESTEPKPETKQK